MRRSIRPVLAVAGRLIGLMPAIAACATVAARAQEPLFLRIRPAGDTPAGLGGAGPSDEDIARAARARSEAVWQRAEQRSRIAIASVCTGCLVASRAAEPSPKSTPPAPVHPDADGVTPVAAESTAVPISPLAEAHLP
ncbi:hypothetical protein [Methylobacterium sp. J-068]|uniref:hypothetical protein n=1 Tax=Methylobacterium sp. J-068 TaxID=2836649 RepID=UPI001FBBE31B|nr:hypothetical protein [Methylobacterium sp. J-068]MCJ2035324.1 hypothetical protein [Methylobacterium sp. J-068]